MLLIGEGEEAHPLPPRKDFNHLSLSRLFATLAKLRMRKESLCDHSSTQSFNHGDGVCPGFFPDWESSVDLAFGFPRDYHTSHGWHQTQVALVQTAQLGLVRASCSFFFCLVVALSVGRPILAAHLVFGGLRTCHAAPSR